MKRQWDFNIRTVIIADDLWELDLTYKKTITDGKAAIETWQNFVYHDIEPSGSKNEIHLAKP